MTTTTLTARRPLPLLTRDQIALLDPKLAEPISYRKSGLSVNHIVGCPLDCGYCVRHLFHNFAMKTPRALMSDEAAVELLCAHPFFHPDLTPIQLFNRATDPMLPVVKPHTFRVLQLLDERGLHNHVLIITRWRVDEADCEILNSYRNIKVTVLVTHSGIEDERIEPVNSLIAATSLKTLHANAESYRTILYWRPIVPGLNDSDQHLARALELSEHAHATVFTGLFYKDQIAAYYREQGLPEPYDDPDGAAKRKIFPEQLEARILRVFQQADERSAPWGSLFRKTSCGVAYAHGEADYNGHYGIRELCDICPIAQLGRCAEAWHDPDMDAVAAQVRQLGAVGDVELTERAIIVEGLDDGTRNYLQHYHGFQFHDRNKPHHHRRHGRAEIGWPAPSAD
jgi:DNA repair photolyase